MSSRRTSVISSLSATAILRRSVVAMTSPNLPTARIGERTLPLTGLEFDLLVALAKRAGRVLPREALLEAAGRGDVVVSERTVDVHLSWLRRKLGETAQEPRYLHTVRGVGVKLVEP
jgi:DNA-binding response OmpR family regulator